MLQVGQVANEPPERPPNSPAEGARNWHAIVGDGRAADRLMRIVEFFEAHFQPSSRDIGREVIALIQYLRALVMHRPDLAPSASAPEVGAAFYSHPWLWGAGWWPNASGGDGNDDWASGPWIAPPSGLGA